ncbi:MAG TPA: hypothetical protein VFE30_10720 [Anaeromyxobacteraceae bacterium]|jgi:hypothetical protein|nr:hypothetical protein [Anaeromyxobacteraceae bacterium]
MHEALTLSSVTSLDSAALARRLGELAGEERQVQADFLLHLDAFDRRRGYLDAGYTSLWEFCQKALHLREGAAGRRIAAMRVLRRFPALASALREGRLCLSTLGLLGPVLTEENVEEVLARAAFRTRAEVDRLVASLQPRAAPKDGIRRVVRNGQSLLSPELSIPARVGTSVAAAPALGTPTSHLGAALEPATPAPPGASDPPVTFAGSAPAPAPVPGRPELRPVSEESYSLRVTLDAAFKDDLDQFRQLLSHKVPNGDLSAVLREAVRCGIEKHGKRRGAVTPTRTVASPKAAPAKAQGAARSKVATMHGPARELAPEAAGGLFPRPRPRRNPNAARERIATPSPPPSAGRSGPGTAAGAPGRARTAAAARAAGSSSSTTWSRSRSAGPPPPRTFA